MNEKTKPMTEVDLQKLENRFSQLLGNQKPRSSYVKRLKNELKNSRIFELRRSIGAILVASLGVLFAGALSFSIAVLAQKARRRLNF
jgi:hypothetical protein